MAHREPGLANIPAIEKTVTALHETGEIFFIQVALKPVT
jgi:hypothetical protein